jgi:hypothetical protein
VGDWYWKAQALIEQETGREGERKRNKSSPDYLIHSNQIKPRTIVPLSLLHCIEKEAVYHSATARASQSAIAKIVFKASVINMLLKELN